MTIKARITVTLTAVLIAIVLAITVLMTVNAAEADRYYLPLLEGTGCPPPAFWFQDKCTLLAPPPGN